MKNGILVKQSIESIALGINMILDNDNLKKKFINNLKKEINYNVPSKIEF